MRVLILLIQRFFNLILFLGLEIICFVLIARTNTLQGNEVMNSANLASAYWYKQQSGISYYFGLRQMNDSLLNENARLHQLIARQSEIDTLTDSTVVRGLTPPDSAHVIQYAHYTYFRARVINNSVNASSNFITINRGSKDGIQPNMAVVSGNGIVGRVVNVSKHFATLLSILNNKQPVSARLRDGTTGFVNWEAGARPDELFMKNIPQEIVIKPGDTVYTTSYSTLFPADLIIGTVVKVEKIKKDNSQFLHIRPATNFRNVQYVYVIKDDYMEERRRLEDSTTKNTK